MTGFGPWSANKSDHTTVNDLSDGEFRSRDRDKFAQRGAFLGKKMMNIERPLDLSQPVAQILHLQCQRLDLEHQREKIHLFVALGLAPFQIAVNSQESQG